MSMMVYSCIRYYTVAEPPQHSSDLSNQRGLEIHARERFCDEVSYLPGVWVHPRGPGAAILLPVLSCPKDEKYAQQMAMPPTGTVTFLFMDIEGSTASWQDKPEAMQDTLAHHVEILRHTIEDCGASPSRS
jgi:hypothetical protein